MMSKIQISVLICVKDSAYQLPECLKALSYFDDVIVIDSYSEDGTQEVCKDYNVQYELYQWNGQYPKKRQWVLDNVNIKHDYIFFIDADEIVTPELIHEMQQLKFSCVGYFVKGQYELNGKILRFGLKNNKLSLFHKDMVYFPEINDLGESCMGEMEGHYQPVLKSSCSSRPIGQINAPLIHKAYNNEWEARHDRYAKWEASMLHGNKYPCENDAYREFLKNIFRHTPCRPIVAFIHSYVLNLGFLDGVEGFYFARSRYHYYKKVRDLLNTNKSSGTTV